MSQPGYRRPPRSGAGKWGILVPLFAFMIFAIWPYAVWHGCKYGGSGLSGCGAESEWVWNGQTWAACGIWWGICALPVALALAGVAAKGKPLRPAKPARAVTVPPSVTEALEIAGRLAGPDPAVTARLLKGLDAVDGYAGQVEQAQTGEELDYLQAHGKLPDSWPFRDPHRKGEPS